jgi:hypothetical protein
MEYPIYIKAYDKWAIKIISEDKMIEIKNDFYTKIDGEKYNFKYRVETYNNKDLIRQWINDLENPDEPDYEAIEEEEFLIIYFKTLYEINVILGG